MSASIDALIAQLSLTITHPNPSPPPPTLPGTAFGSDQAPIQGLIGQLRSADANNDLAQGILVGAVAAAAAASAASVQASSDYAANLTAGFNAWDRSVRALETLILAANPGAPVNPAIHISTSDIFAARVRTETAINLAKPLNISADSVAAAKAAPAAYLSFSQSAPLPLDPQPARAREAARGAAASAQLQLTQLIAQATQYLTYLGTV